MIFTNRFYELTEEIEDLVADIDELNKLRSSSSFNAGYTDIELENKLETLLEERKEEII